MVHKQAIAYCGKNDGLGLQSCTSHQHDKEEIDLPLVTDFCIQKRFLMPFLAPIPSPSFLFHVYFSERIFGLQPLFPQEKKYSVKTSLQTLTQTGLLVFSSNKNKLVLRSRTENPLSQFLVKKIQCGRIILHHFDLCNQ